MLSKNQIKYINSLQIKKFRQIHQSFLVEGAKSVEELLASDYQVETVIATEEFVRAHETSLSSAGTEILTASPDQLAGLGNFQTNDACVAVAKTKENTFLAAETGEFVLVLDDIRDPGNLGTIIRVADWYGFRKVVCSRETTDFYNPKVIAASKGSFTRVKAFYTDLPLYLSGLGGIMLIGAFLEGTSHYDFRFPASGGYLVMGNESKGIGEGVSRLVTHRITIPRFGGAESLNVGIATAVICDAIRRETSRHE